MQSPEGQEAAAASPLPAERKGTQATVPALLPSHGRTTPSRPPKRVFLCLLCAVSVLGGIYCSRVGRRRKQLLTRASIITVGVRGRRQVSEGRAVAVSCPAPQTTRRTGANRTCGRGVEGAGIAVGRTCILSAHLP